MSVYNTLAFFLQYLKVWNGRTFSTSSFNFFIYFYLFDYVVHLSLLLVVDLQKQIKDKAAAVVKKAASSKGGDEEITLLKPTTKVFILKL